MARSNGKPNGAPRPQMQRQVQVPVLRTTILHVFQCELVPTNDGGQDTPNGEQLVVALGAEHALELGKALLAPSVAIASAQASALIH